MKPDGKLPLGEAGLWCKELQRDSERALAETKLPERPDSEAANRFLVKARRAAPTIRFRLTCVRELVYLRR